MLPTWNNLAMERLARRQAKRKQRRYHRLGIEPLEARTLLTVTPSLSGSKAIFVGDGDNNTLTLTLVGSPGTELEFAL